MRQLRMQDGRSTTTTQDDKRKALETGRTATVANALTIFKFVSHWWSKNHAQKLGPTRTEQRDTAIIAAIVATTKQHKIQTDKPQMRLTMRAVTKLERTA